LYLPSLIKKKKEEGTIGSLKDFWLPIGVVVGLALFFVVVLQKDLGTGAVLLTISVSIIFASGVPLRQFLAMLAIVGAAGVLAIAFSSHRMERLTTFLGGGDADSNYHIDNAKIAIGTGGLFGVGIGNSVQATGYLPESINDSVFAIMGETFGFVGLMIILMVFITVPMRILKVSEGTADTEGRLAAIGVFAWFLTHVIVNVAAMTGLIPLTGITLPLLSYGGTSIAFMALALGLTLQLSCYTSREVNNEDTSSGRGLRGSYYSSRRRRS
jgi:cell division protein FtsW